MAITWGDIKHFKPREFACKCGECDSDGTEMQLDYVFKLDDLRERLGAPLIVTSGYRCPAYNQRISNTGPNGPHTTGRASDVKASGLLAFRIVQQCSLGGWFSGIGIHQRGSHGSRFIHLDDLPHGDTRPRVWTY